MKFHLPIVISREAGFRQFKVDGGLRLIPLSDPGSKSWVFVSLLRPAPSPSMLPKFRDYFAGSGVRNSRSKLVAAASFPDIFGEEVEIFSPKFCRESS